MIDNIRYRNKRMNELAKEWGLKKIHNLLLEYKIPNDLNFKFKLYLKNYISKALDISFVENEKDFVKLVNKNKKNRTNVTPNGAVVPKREYNLEYNLTLKIWAEIIRDLTKKKTNLLKYFRMTPNIRIKYAIDFKDNLKRELNTSIPHSDAWVEGPWGMNCYAPIFGDNIRNNLLFYEPINFKSDFLKLSPSYNNMQWVIKNYKKINFKPKKGHLYISDYALIHNTHRSKNCDTRISIDSTIFVDKFNHPPKSRIKEYRHSIPIIGEEEFIDSGQYVGDHFAEKKGVYTHYTSKVLKSIKLPTK